MATKKTPAKAPAKKTAPKKAAPAKKVVVKSAPAKKPIVNKKATPAKKAVPAKKAAPKPAAKKAVAKPVVKKPIAKVVAKPVAKVAPKKPLAKPVAKKQIAKVVPAKKVEAKSAKEVKPAKPVKAEKPAKPAKAPKVPKQVAPIKKIIKAAPAKVIPSPKPEEKPQSVRNPVKAPPAKPEVRKPLVMPKINTKTARKYEPDFTKSVLDKAAVIERTEEIVKYSDADLAEFKELILRKLGSAKKELSYLQGLLTRKDDMGGDDGDGRYMTMEDGSLSMEREQLSQMASRQITFVDHLEKALMRIENKTYGVCRVTGKLIDKARLRAVPHATLSIEAKMSGSK